MSWRFVFRRRLWIIRNDDNAAVTPSVVELMAFSSAPSTFPVFRLIGTPACRLPWWNARERCDKALMGPKSLRRNHLPIALPSRQPLCRRSFASFAAIEIKCLVV
jgi:hypothetical protein